MKKYIIISADENDGDYITKKSSVSDIQIEDLKIILAIIGIRKHNWDNTDIENLIEKYSGLLTKEQIMFFNKYVPCNDYGVHTIVKVEIIEVLKEYNIYENL